MTDGLDPTDARAVVSAIDPAASVVSVHPLEGGISAEMTRVVLTDRTWVVRRHRSAPDAVVAAITEHRLLSSLVTTDVPVPAPVALDVSRKVLDEPYLVLEFVDGACEYDSVDRLGFAETLADQLAAVHSVPTGPLGPLPDRHAIAVERITTDRAPDPTVDEATIRALLRDHPPAGTRNTPALLHGDFWMGNLVWHDGRIAAVIDWESACLGDPLADLASTRLDVLWALGLAAMERFTVHYVESTGVDTTDLAWWDLVAAQRPAGDLPAWAQWWERLGRPDIDAHTMRRDLLAFASAAGRKLTG